eukprot:Sro277_g106190.2  (244) ;mRNA; r:15614-16345
MSSGSVSVASSQGSGPDRRRRSSTNRQSMPEQRSSDATATWSLADIDVVGDGDCKDESVVTPATVSSSSAEEKLELEVSSRTAKTGETLRRTKSTGSHFGGNNKSDGKSHRQASQKSLSSAARKEQKRQESQKSTAKNPFSEPSNKSAFLVKADQLDPFGSQHNERSGGTDPFDPFAPSVANDPFGLSKKEKPKTKVDDLGPSFHLTNDFGDFGNESFGSVNFDGQDGFDVVRGEKSTRSLLG